MRSATITRQTKETNITLTLVLDGRGGGERTTGVAFFDHMLDHVAKHGMFDLTINAQGDYAIDDHHTVEDVGIVLGKALAQALGDKAGIRRYGDAIVPMDETLALCAVDFSGRGLLGFQGTIPAQKVGTFDTELVPEFLRALAANAGMTLHVQVLAGQNSHHIIEGIFKALGRALREAVEIDPRRQGEVPSTKGMIE
jgi:imidazoleglycerol-phosphate dehydratase